jgi:hypothetical protein
MLLFLRIVAKIWYHKKDQVFNCVRREVAFCASAALTAAQLHATFRL